MAAKPYKFYDRRGTNSYGGNSLIPAATRTTDRKQPPNLQYDTHRNITSWGLATLRDASRSLFWKYPTVQGALLEQAEMSISHFVPEFYTADRAWNEAAAELLSEFDDMFDVRGWPYDRDAYLHNLVMHTRLDGTFWTLLTESSGGFPMVQVIPAHRIGGLADSGLVADSDNFLPPMVTTDAGERVPYDGQTNPWAGFRIIAGAIVNEAGAALAYRVYDDMRTNPIDISAQSLFPTFFPIVPDQVVGIPSLAVCAFDFQDVGETRDFEKLAQKVAARVTLIETNEGGEPPPGVELLNGDTTAGGTTGLKQEVLEGGIYHYLKGGTDSSIQTLVADRPSSNQQAFEDKVLRGCFYGIEWSYDFTLNPGASGGAQQRVIVGKINRTCKKNRKLASKPMARIDGYRIRKFIKLGMIRDNPEWWKVRYHGPAEETADRKYESEIDIEESNKGWLPDAAACGKRGMSVTRVRADVESDADAHWAAAKRIADKWGITIQEAYASMWEDNPNGVSSASGAQKQTNGGNDQQQSA